MKRRSMSGIGQVADVGGGVEVVVEVVTEVEEETGDFVVGLVVTFWESGVFDFSEVLEAFVDLAVVVFVSSDLLEIVAPAPFETSVLDGTVVDVFTELEDLVVPLVPLVDLDPDDLVVVDDPLELVPVSGFLEVDEVLFSLV